MQLDAIATFVKVVQLQSFSKAAAQLGLPKSGVSRRIAKLEEDLGVRLLRRTTRALFLTDVGASYYERAGLALEALRDAESAAKNAQASPTGTVRFSAPLDVGLALLPDIVASFAKKYPGIRVDGEFSQRRVDLVAEGIDLALRVGKLSDSSLTARRVGKVQNAIVATPKYFATEGRPRTARDLGNHQCILFRPKDDRARWPLHGPGGLETVDVRGALGGDDFTFVRELALRSMGIALVPAFLVYKDIAQKRLARVLPEYTTPGVDFHIVQPATRFVPQRVRLFSDFLHAELQRTACGKGA
jgi:DNA-binding transcriptional LysR family regulator